jgi:exodeoxyribonuclease V alpha subunit
MTRPPQFYRRTRPKTPPQSALFPDNSGKLTGTIERIRFRAEDTGYTVLVVQPDGDFPTVVVVGHLSSLREGERVRFEGEWKEHPRFGRQLQAALSQPIVPTTAEGIEKFLASGTVKNIGPALAKRIVALFGEDTLEVIENEPRRLLKVSGLGEKKLVGLIESWKSQSEVKEVMLFLQDHDIPLHLAEKIFRAYGSAATHVLREDPYRLATDIFGVGFRTADRVAQKMGIPADDPGRCAAGAVYVLNRLGESEGHVFVPYAQLVAEAAEILEVAPGQVEEAIENLQKSGGIVVEDLATPGGGSSPGGGASTGGGPSPGGRAVYAQTYFAAETEVARRLMTLKQAARDGARFESALKGKGASGANLAERLAAVAGRALEGGMATGDQARAIERALVEKILIVTGGPGTGKTTVIDAVTKLYLQLGLQVVLGAPTGRAAKRLSEVTRHDASTIHRLLEFSWASGGFLRDAANPLTADVVIIDETSMMDIHLMAHLLRAVPDAASFILVGDVDQLPSVGPGNVLRDAIDSTVLPVVRLREVFRQAKESLIVENAHRVNRGEMPREPKGNDDLRDYYFIEENDAERCADILVELCRERIRGRFGLDPIRDVQVISPMQRGALGVQKLNVRLQEALNPPGAAPSIQAGGRIFRQGDKVIQIRNNYDKNVFNGDIGLIRSVDPSAGTIRVEYDPESVVDYSRDSLDEVIHAYAVTVHKSQGSEYPAVVIPLHNQHYPMLQRNLVYTALTRAKRLAVFIGSKKALAMAVKNAKVRRRWSRLAERLRESAGLPAIPMEAGNTPPTGEMEAGNAPLAGEDAPVPENGAAASERKSSGSVSDWDERPPDSVYEDQAGKEEEEPPAAGELTYHPVDE